MKPKVIRNEADYKAVLARLDAVFEVEAGTPEGDEAELLTTLIEMYEEKIYPMELPTPLEAIQFRKEQQGLKNKDLIPFIGSASKVSEVLSGRRSLSLTMIRKLVKGLGIPAEVLAGQPRVHRLVPDAIGIDRDSGELRSDRGGGESEDPEEEEGPDFPPLSPVGRGAEAPGRRKREWRGAALSHPTLGRQR